MSPEELGEYVVAESGWYGLHLTYGDTISDHGVSTLGRAAATIVAGYLNVGTRLSDE